MQLRSFRPVDPALDPRGGAADRAIDLHWSGEPEGTRSFVVLIEDSQGDGTPWIRFDVPAVVHDLSTAETRIGVRGGTESAAAWREPAPLADGRPNYTFRLYALDVQTLGLPQGAGIEEVEARMQGHVLDSAAADERDATAEPAARPRPRRNRLRWAGYIVLGVVVLLLAVTGLSTAGVLGAAALVVLMIWAWRRMADRPADPTQPDPAQDPADR